VPTENSALEIHGYLTCPFAWRVRLAAAEKGVPAEFLPCDIEEPDPRVKLHNPDEHSPLLYHQPRDPERVPHPPRRGSGGQSPPAPHATDSLTLTESGIIVTYLDEAFAAAGPALMPEDARGRALLRLLAKRLEPLDVHMEPARPEARKRSEAALNRLEAELMTRATPFLHGPQPGYADVMIWPFLADLHLRHLLDVATWPAGDAYLDRARARPSFHATRPPWAATL
jgi:glutathione S-transferase